MTKRVSGDSDNRTAHPSVLVGGAFTIVFLLAVCSWRPWTLFSRGAFSTDFYDAQARAFLRLRLDVPADVAGIEGFVVDGDTYLYFGPLLAFARMPFALFGQWADGHLVRLSLVLGFAAFCAASYRLALESREWMNVAEPDRDESADGRRIALFVAAAACSPALALFGWVSVYHETELWAATFTTAAAAFVLALLRTPKRRPLVLALAFVFAAVLTRASVGMGAAVALGLAGLLLWRQHRRIARGCIAGAITAPLTHAVINYAKFGSLFGLPAEQQVLTKLFPDRATWFAGNDGSFFGSRFLTTTLRHYFRPDTIRFERLLPGLRFGPRADDIGSYPLESNTPSSSLTAAATILLLLAVVGLVLIVRRRQWSWLLVTVAMACGAIPTFLIGFIANRYLADMLPMLLVPAALAALAIPSPTGRGAQRTLVAGAVVLIAWGSWVNLALGTWLQQLQAPGFTQFRYRVDELLLGGQPPGLQRLDVRADVPRDGAVAIDRRCRGVYIAVSGSWFALELGGSHRVVGEFVPGADPVVLTTAAERLEVLVRNGTLQAHLFTSDRTVRGDPTDWDGNPVVVDITSDTVTAGFRVLINGEVAVGQLVPLALRDAEFGSSFSRQPVATPLCDQLQDRLRDS